MKSAVLALALALAASAADALHPHDEQLLSKLESYDVLTEDPFAARRRALRGEPAAVDRFKYTLRALGTEHELDLELYRELFSEDYRHVHVDAAGTHKVVSTEKDCVYRAGKRSVVSFCGGVVNARFTASDGDEVHVRPLASGEHIAFRRRHLSEEHSGKCGVDDDFVAEENRRAARVAAGAPAEKAHGRALREESDHAHSHLHHAAGARVAEGVGATEGRRLMNDEVELVIFNDHRRFERLGVGVEADTAFIASLVADLYTELPGSNPVVVKLSGIFTMVDSDPWPKNITNGGRSVDVADLLDDFSVYVGSLVTFPVTNPVLPQFDHVHLLSDWDFIRGNNDGVIGLASLGSLCIFDGGSGTRTRGSGVTQSNFDDRVYTGNVFTHELGHNLGMQHTDVIGTALPVSAASSPCDAPATEVMDATAGSDPVWSACTFQYWASNLPSKIAISGCMDADAAVIWSPPVCGNGIVEAGEDCDCYLNDCGLDTCCNATSCEFLGAATCFSGDACCNVGTCMPAASGIPCRASAHAQCDPAPETCDGVSAKCPLDVVAPAGTSCPGDGECWLGKCFSMDQQCEALGFANGGCGNLACNSNLRCKATPDMPGPDACASFFTPSGHFIDDGTPCSTGQCYQGNCVDSNLLPTPAELADCTNGVKDNVETDIDCGGGSCLPCFGGKNCSVDTDCLFPGTCNATLGVCQVTGGTGVRGDGSGEGEGPGIEDQIRDAFQKFLDWAKANPAAAGGAGAALFVVLFFCCFGCVCCGGKDKVPKYARQMKQASFRNLRGGRKQDLAPVMQH